MSISFRIVQAFRSSRSVLRALRRLDQRLNDCWLGHIIGAAALFLLLFNMSIIVGALQ